MLKLLPKLFIKDYKNITNSKVRNAYGSLAGIVGIVSNLLISTIKIIAGVFSTSMALVADGLNNLSDGASSIITLIGFKVSSKPADKDHPFGHQRFEYITGLIISFLVLFVGTSLLRSGIEKIITPEDVKPNIIIFSLIVFSIIVKIWQFFFYRSCGKLINSNALKATSTDSLNDIITSTAILISLLIVYFFEINLDGYMTVAVSLYIIYTGISLIKSTISPLIGEAPCSDLTKNVTNDILSFKGVLGIHDLVVHTYGPGKTFITAHVEVDASVNVVKSHDMIDEIERYISEKHNTNLVIHMDPIETKDEYTNSIRTEVDKILNVIDSELCYHDFRVVKGSNHDNIIFDLEYPVDYKISETELREEITKRVKDIYPKCKLIIDFDMIFNDEE